MLLAGDIGGTKSRLAIFADGADPRHPLAEELLPSGRYSGIEALIRAFFKRTNLKADRACFAIAGPVINGRAAVTNLPWIADAAAIRRALPPGSRTCPTAWCARAVTLCRLVRLSTTR